MKWTVFFTSAPPSGPTREEVRTVEAPTILRALELADRTYCLHLRKVNYKVHIYKIEEEEYDRH